MKLTYRSPNLMEFDDLTNSQLTFLSSFGHDCAGLSQKFIDMANEYNIYIHSNSLKNKIILGFRGIDIYKLPYTFERKILSELYSIKEKEKNTEKEISELLYNYFSESDDLETVYWDEDDIYLNRYISKKYLSLSKELLKNFKPDDIKLFINTLKGI